MSFAWACHFAALNIFDIIDGIRMCWQGKDNQKGDIVRRSIHYTQPAITCSKLKVETLEQGMKYVQS